MPPVDDVKSRLDILDLVSRYAPLQRSGRSYRALCPFHTEKTASFFVFPERQSWRCFGACATGGDIFSFFMRIENLDFGEALKRLAQQAGINLPERRARKSEDDELYRINEAAMEFYRHGLRSHAAGSSARAYLQGRGLSQETIETFQLGLSPAGGESLHAHLASNGYGDQRLALAGVVTKGQDNRYRDMFRGRLMFPIRDAGGRLAGFGGRSLDGSHPKYLNSARSPIFDKSSILYALHLAKDAAREKGIVIVEGYMDAIAAHQHGFSNVAASMGTALTQQQVTLVCNLIRRPGSSGSADVILALDPDTAGQEATLRSLESSWRVFQTRLVGRAHGASIYERPEAPSVKVAPLPEGKDPDEIILESPEEWSRLVDNAAPLIDYLFSALSSRLDLGTPQGKSRLAELLFPLVAATPDPFQQDHYFQRLAALLGVSEATLQASLGRPRPGRSSSPGRTYRPLQGRGAQPNRGNGESQGATATPFARLDHDPLEEHCLALILQNPQLLQPPQPGTSGEGGYTEATSKGLVERRSKAGDLRLEYFQRVENREVFTNWMKCSTLDALRGTLDEEIQEHLEYLVSRQLPPSDLRQKEMALSGCFRRLEERYLRELKLEEELRLSQVSPEELEEQSQGILELNERIKLLYRD